MLADPAYSVEGRVASIARYNAALGQSFGYDHAGRLASLDLGQGQTNSAKVGWDFTRNAAGQILTDAHDNNAYAWTGRVNVGATYTTNGLNQYTQYAGNDATGFCYDPNGNLTADKNSAYLYDAENRLVEMHVRQSPSACPAGASGYGGQLQARLHYDPNGRLAESLGYVSGVLSTTTRFVYDGDALVLEYDGNGALANRYLHGADAKADDPLIWYPGSSTATANIRNLYADARGSIVLVMDQAGSTSASSTGINTYDEWGANQGAASVGRFQYTGQAWIPETGLYYYKARFYSPTLGRFMQTDPVGYADQVDLYAYVGDDPVNNDDPTGSNAAAAAAIGCAITSEIGCGEGAVAAVALTAGATACVALQSCRNEAVHQCAESILCAGAVIIGALAKEEGEADEPAKKPVRNPDGKKGGQKHQDKVKDRIGQLQAEGKKHIAGGDKPEERVDTPGGKKGSRHPDITMENPDGSGYRENVGLNNKRGDPVSRERDALDDIEKATGQCAFTSYGCRK